MKKYFATAVMAMVMVVMLAIPVYADNVHANNGSTAGIDKSHHNVTGDTTSTTGNCSPVVQDSFKIQDSFQDNRHHNGNNRGNDSSITVEDSFKGNNTAFNGGTVVDGNANRSFNEGTVAGGDVITEGGSVGDVDNSNSNNADNSNKNKQVNKQEVNIENPDEIKINSQLTPMAGQQVDTIEYHGETLEDHKYQDEILEFLLAAEGPKPFKVRERGFFTRKSSHSDSKDLSVKEYEETTTVYVFRDIADLEANIESYSIVGYADTFSKGKASLMDCFDQAVIDSGEMGGNIVVILDVAYINALKSTTTGLGGSGAAGIMKNATQSSVFGAALGYASSKATPETDPFIHGMVLYSAEFPAEKVPEKAEPVDHFTNE